MTTPESTPLRVAIIGSAFMGTAHSAGWRNVAAHFDVPAVEQTVMVARDAARVAEAAARLGWKESATDWREVIARDDIDIVDVCVPGRLHAEVAIAALEAGKHVIVEKPIANTLDEAERMNLAADAALARGQHAIVNFNYRRVPAIALAKKLVDDGRLGALRHVRVAYLQDWLADANAPMSWRLRKEDSGSGALGDLGSHSVDLVQYLTGEGVESLSGRLHTFVTERPSGESGGGAIGGLADAAPSTTTESVTVDDAAWLTASLTGGAIAQIEVSRMATGRKNGLTVELNGELGSIRFSLEDLNELWFFDQQATAGEQGFRRILVTEADHPYVGHWWPDGHIIGWEHTFSHQFAEFLQSIRSGEASSPSFADGLRVQRVLDAVERSSATESRIILIQTEGA